MASAAHQVTIGERIARFDAEGTLGEECRAVAAVIAEDCIRVARRFWSHFGSYTEVGDQRWVDMVEGFVAEAAAEGVTLSTLLASISAAAEEGHSVLAEKLTGEPERLGAAGGPPPPPPPPGAG